MKDWLGLINDWCESKRGVYSLVLGAPATSEELENLSNFLGRRLPDEFISLYSSYNGIGVRDSTDTNWVFVPTANLISFVTESRKWFEDTHPFLADRFFPFVDWWTSDTEGYLWGPDEKLVPFLYEFSHEHYEFDEKQGWQEFMVKGEVSIEKFLQEYPL